MGVRNDFLSVLGQSRIWILMGGQDIAMRYRRSMLGPFWISIAMGAMVLAIGLLYSQVQQVPFKEFLTFFGCGILAWTFISSMVTEGSQTVIESDSHLRNLPIPLPILAARIVYRNFVIFLHNALVIVLMLSLLGEPLTWTALLAIPALLLYLPLGLLIALSLGPLCARFRDMPQMITSALQILFFLTPIFWVPGHLQGRLTVVDANPFYHLVEIVRAPLMGNLPTAHNWVMSLAATAFMALLALASLSIARRRVYLWL